MHTSPSFAVSLNDLAVIEIAGADAADFLHGQLTQDIAGLPSGAALLAGYCTAKGRLLATLAVWRDPAGADLLYALVKADIAQALVKRLSMYVLRAKARLSVSARGVAGVWLAFREDGQAQAPDGLDTSALPADPAPWQVVASRAGTWIAAPLPRGERGRWWLVRPEDAPAPPRDAQAQAVWQAADIDAGLPWVQAATQDLFIPQTLNLDLVQAVSFTKGCYPGQEVVARSHYRGTVKRRMACGTAIKGPEPAGLPGTDIFDGNAPDSPCGRVVDAAQAHGKLHLLLEVQLADLDNGDFRLGSAQGPRIILQALPYDIVASAQAK